MKNLSNEELLKLKAQCNVSMLTGSGRAYTLALRIPELIDEIIRLREFEWKYNELSK